jgi:hypothetical protein
LAAAVSGAVRLTGSDARVSAAGRTVGRRRERRCQTDRKPMRARAAGRTAVRRRERRGQVDGKRMRARGGPNGCPSP